MTCLCGGTGKRLPSALMTVASGAVTVAHALVTVASGAMIMAYDYDQCSYL